MGQVSVKVAKDIASGIAESKGVSTEEVVSNSTLPQLLQLKDSDWLTWNKFAEWMREFDQSSWAPVNWKRAGQLGLVPEKAPLAALVFRMTISVRNAYWMGSKWLGPSYFRVIRSHFEDLGPNKIRESLRISDDLDPCPQIFQVFEGTLSIMPKSFLGLEESVVQAHVTGRTGTYEVTLPAQKSHVLSLYNYFRNFFKWKFILHELSQQQTALTMQATRLVEERAEMKMMMSHFPDGIMVHRQGHIVYVNQMMCKMLNCADASELIGKSCLDNVLLADREKVKNRIAKFQVDPKFVNPPVEIKFEKMGTRELAVGEVTSMALTFDGEPCVLLVTRDLSERKKLQAQLLESDRLASLGHLAAGVGHEINNPLCYVMMKLDSVNDAIKGKVDEQTEKSLADMEEGLIRIQGIVKELKALSFAQTIREDEGAMADVSSAIRSALSIAQNEIQHRAELHLLIPELPMLKANESQLSQVFLNLLINSAQSIEPGRAHENKISVRATCENDTVRIQISDTGCGISDEGKKRLFKPFYTTKPAGQGTGLGLSISQSIVERFKGRIDCESKVGEGSTFTVSFPISLGKNPAEVSPLSAVLEPLRRSSPLPNYGPQGRLLLVDDDEVLLETLVTNISPHHHVTGAATAEDALNFLRRGAKFDLIICDLMMPNMGGIEFYQALHQEFPQACDRIIFLTGGSFTPKTHAFLDRPEIRSFDKPIRRDDLLKAIAENLSRTGIGPDQA